jgi:hypothetical protein
VTANTKQRRVSASADRIRDDSTWKALVPCDAKPHKF